jgi:HlyD family secretion protein
VAGLVLAAIAGIAFVSIRPRPLPPEAGMVRATEIRIAPELSGRVGRIRVQTGDAVRAGDMLAELDNPELAAAAGEAKAALGEAVATRARVYAGVRQEQVDMLAREVDKAGSNLVLARQQFQRIAALAANDNAPRQRLDEVTAAVAMAEANLALATASHAEAQAGPTAEERAVADAAVGLAQAMLVVVEQRLAKTVLHAPVAGRVRVVVAEPGEAIRPGQPVLTLEASPERHVTVDLREDRLGGIGVGAAVDLAIAGDGRKVPARVTEERRLGDFATWRAARAVGDHDLNTFLLRVDPEGGSAGLEPGMTLFWPTTRPSPPRRRQATPWHRWGAHFRISERKVLRRCGSPRPRS